MAAPLGGSTGFNIDTFKSNFSNAAKNYLFYVGLDNPAWVGTDAKQAMYLVRSSVIPGKTIEKKELGWQGYKMPFGGSSTHEDWTVTFIVDPKAAIYKSMIAWSNMVHDPKTNRHGNPVEYMRDQTIQMISLDGTASILDIKLIGAWPQNVANLELNYDNTDNATFAVTFCYIRHEYV